MNTHWSTLMRPSLALALIVLAGAGTACGDAAGPATAALPSELRLRASAAGVDAELDIECLVAGVVELEQEVVDAAEHRVQRGTGGGEAMRSLLRPDGSATQFWADYYMATLEVHRIGADSLEIRDIGNYTDGVPSRFWCEMLVFRGHTTPSERSAGVIARGTWTCHPMDTPASSGGYHDAVGTVAGTWTLSTQ